MGFRRMLGGGGVWEIAEELGVLRLTAVAVNVSMEVVRDGGGQDRRSQKSFSSQLFVIL